MVKQDLARVSSCKPGVLFIVSASSGAGKTSLVNALIARLKPFYSIDKVVTHTSRAPRQGEIQGIDYHFMHTQDFENKIAQGFFLEWSTVYGTYYGSPYSIVNDLEQGNSRILIIDRLGTQNILKSMADLPYKVVTLLISVPSIEVLRDRLQARGLDEPEKIERRLALAAQEIAQEKQSSLYEHEIMNDLFENSLEKLENLAKKYF
jgi:guanylate kinase